MHLLRHELHAGVARARTEGLAREQLQRVLSGQALEQVQDQGLAHQRPRGLPACVQRALPHVRAHHLQHRKVHRDRRLVLVQVVPAHVRQQPEPLGHARQEPARLAHRRLHQLPVHIVLAKALAPDLPLRDVLDAQHDQLAHRRAQVLHVNVVPLGHHQHGPDQIFRVHPHQRRRQGQALYRSSPTRVIKALPLRKARPTRECLQCGCVCVYASVCVCVRACASACVRVLARACVC
jgi:hypothetical protein